MDREEQIKSVACKQHSVSQEVAFTRGTEWSDRNPSNATILRIVALYKQWYTTESSGSIEEYVKQHWEDK